MTEWTVVTVVIALGGFLLAVVRPLITLNTVITRLTAIVDSLGKSLDTLAGKNAEAHGRLWDKLSEHDGKISDHEKRLYKMESTEK